MVAGQSTFINVIKEKTLKMGKRLTKPWTEKESDEQAGSGFKSGLSAMQGWTCFMQDVPIFKPHFGHLKTFALFLVLDGFDGDKFALQVSRELSEFILKTEFFQNLNDGDAYDENLLVSVLKESIVDFDEKLREVYESSFKSGCTLSGVLITPKHFFMLNVGRSRTLLCRERKLSFVTDDHLAWRYKERRRVEEAGGFIQNSRVNGKMIVSRALGNYAMKVDKRTRKRKISQVLSPEPDVTVIERSHGNDDFIAIATDAVFKSLSNEELIDYLVKRIPYKRHLKELAGDVLDYCCHKNSKDNLTLMLVHFDDSSIQQQTEKIDHDEKLDEEIRVLTRKYVERMFADGRTAYGWNPCFDKLEQENLNLFSSEKNTQLYGIALKKGVIFKEFDKLTTEIRRSRNAEALRKLEADKINNANKKLGNK